MNVFRGCVNGCLIELAILLLIIGALVVARGL
jgi:hypothetical protein